MLKNKAKIVILICLSLLSLFSGMVSAEIRVVDFRGVETQLKEPAQRIVCISSALNEILAVLGVADRVVGKDNLTQFPSIYNGVPIVASSSNNPQIEAILELKPDLIIADTMFKEDVRKKFALFGVPVIVERSSEQERLFQIIRNLAMATGTVERGEEIIEFIEHYEDLIEERLADLPEEERVSVYWEWNQPYKTGTAGASVDSRITFTGGRNISRNLDGGDYPIVSSEFIWMENPDVIIKMSNRLDTVELMSQSYEEITNRVGLRDTSAVKNGRVYVISWEVHTGIRSVLGSLYYAKWFHPELFRDLNIAEIHEKVLRNFYGGEEVGTIVYPIY